MKTTTYFFKKYAIALLALAFSCTLSAQLNVSVSVTDETCPGTGALSLSVSNANPAAPVVYKVYLLPETTIPVWNSTTSYVPAMQDGDYLVVASQEIGGGTTTGQANATINSLYVPIQFQIDNSASACSGSNDMIVDVTAGDPATYEILSGPVTAGPQSSNTFPNMQPGTYELRVTDVCGNGYVGTYTFFVQQTTSLAVTDASFPSATLPNCSKMNATWMVNLDSGPGIVYPLSIIITVTPPGGGTPVQYTQNAATGNNNSLTVTQLIDYYPSSYNVSISVTDPCGNVYTKNNTINRPLTVQLNTTQQECGSKSISVDASAFVAPYTISFTSTPAGFNPATFNNAYPGPFSGPANFGGPGNPVPLGSYSVTLTDACGRTASTTTQVTTGQPPAPQVSATNNNCTTQLGRLSITVPGFPLQSATVTAAPSAYTQTLPYNATGLIDADGVLNINNLPQGNYTVSLQDTCGNSYNAITSTIPAFAPTEPEGDARPDCIAGKGTLRISPSLQTASITAAPSGFGQTLPYNVSSQILNGGLSLDNLAPGTYTISVTTTCNQTYTKTIEVTPLVVTANNISVQQTCDDFSINVDYTSNVGQVVTFWLQRRNGNAWQNPATGQVYTSGDEFTADNAVELPAGQASSFTYTGEFRIIRQQRTYAAGTSGNLFKTCSEEIDSFSFNSELGITSIYNRTCVGELFEIQVNTVGVSPRFELISKNGDTTFYVDNGSNRIFTGLESALYVVRVTDQCGEFRTEQFNVADLPPIITASTADDIYFCDDSASGVGTVDLSAQNTAVLGDVSPNIANVTYHATQADADQDINPLPTNYSGGAGTIYARVEWIVNPLCYATSSFALVVSQPFELQMAEEWPMCNGQATTITADPGYTSYLWSTGETTNAITVTEPGSYTVTATNIGGCEAEKTVSAVIINQPLISNVDISDWTDSNNTISVLTDQAGNPAFQYSIDGVTYQDEPVFTDVPAGMYTVYVRDRFGCNPPDRKEIMLAMYPRFFTPNGDGENDTWRVDFAVLEPGLKVQVYDRYGRFLINFGSNSSGWDGTFQGRPLPADDYWFIITRGDGREYKGHFSIMR